MRNSMTTLLALATLLLTSTATAQQVVPGPAAQAWNPEQTPQRFKRHGRRGHRGGKLLARPELLQAKLGLSDTQLVQLRTIHDQCREKTKAYRSQMRQLRRQMRTLIQGETLDGPMIDAVHREMRSLRGKVAELRFGARLQALGVLTKDQRVKLLDGAKQRRQRLRGAWAR